MHEELRTKYFSVVIMYSATIDLAIMSSSVVELQNTRKFPVFLSAFSLAGQHMGLMFGNDLALCVGTSPRLKPLTPAHFPRLIIINITIVIIITIITNTIIINHFTKRQFTNN